MPRAIVDTRLDRVITVENPTNTHDRTMVAVVVDTSLTCASWADLADDKDAA